MKIFKKIVLAMFISGLALSLFGCSKIESVVDGITDAATSDEDKASESETD